MDPAGSLAPARFEKMILNFVPLSITELIDKKVVRIYSHQSYENEKRAGARRDCRARDVGDFLMNYQCWIERTRSEGLKPRSLFLRMLDAAVKSYFEQPILPKLKKMSVMLEKWKQTKKGKWQESIRNRDHAVEELDALIKLQKVKLERGLVFADAAAKARKIEEKLEGEAHSATITWSQTITYKKGDNYNRWDKEKKCWVKEEVKGEEPHMVEFPAKSHFRMLKRGTLIEVRVYCKDAPGHVLPKDVQGRWRTEILSHWNHKAVIVDKRRKYELRFDLVWDPSYEGAYSIKLGNPPPTVHKWGCVFLQEEISDEALFFSEVLDRLLRASDENLSDLITKLEGKIQYKSYVGLPRWRKVEGIKTAPLSTVLKSLKSDDRYWVKSAKSGKQEGPFKVRDLQLRSLIAGGFLTEQTPVKKDGDGHWQNAGDMTAFSRFFKHQSQRDEMQRLQETTMNRDTFGEYDRKAINHEFGHMIGCPDEYRVTSISNTGQEWNPAIYDREAFTSDSIMNDPKKGVLKERHFACVLREYNRWQGAEATIELIKVKAPKAPERNDEKHRSRGSSRISRG